MGMLITHHEGYWPESDEQPVKRAPARELDAYDELTDEQVAEAYATNVGGNATTRKGQVKALRKLEAEASELAETQDPDAEAPETEDQATEVDESAEGDDSGE